MPELDKYLEVRPNILSGSCVLWKGKGIVSWLIHFWSPMTHASLVARLDRYADLKDRIFLFESLEHGPVPRLLSERLSGYKGEAYLFTPKSIVENVELQDHITSEAVFMSAKGIKYDYPNLFMNILGHVNSNASAFFCSEFVDWIWKKCGIPRISGDPKKAPWPADIPTWYDGTLVKIYSNPA